MNKNKKTFVIIGIIVAVIILVSASSYALFMINVTEDTNFKVKVGTLELTIRDTETENNIVLDYLIPTADDVALEKDGYTFNLKNTGTIDSKYFIYLDDVILEKPIDRLDSSLLKVNISNSLTETNETNYYSYYQNNHLPIASGTLTAGEDIDFEIKLWLDYGAGNSAQKKYFATRVRVEAHQSNEKIENNE